MKTFSAKPKEIERKWFVIDATDLVLGRLAAEAAKILRGKHKPLYTPHIDCGDNIVVINAEKIHLTGKKAEQKKYIWHTGYPGGIKERTLENVVAGKFPERVVFKAIERMLPRNPLGRAQLKKLHVYAGTEHPHEGQKPTKIEFAKQNRKNTKAE